MIRNVLKSREQTGKFFSDSMKMHEYVILIKDQHRKEDRVGYGSRADPDASGLDWRV